MKHNDCNENCTKDEHYPSCRYFVPGGGYTPVPPVVIAPPLAHDPVFICTSSGNYPDFNVGSCPNSNEYDNRLCGVNWCRTDPTTLRCDNRGREATIIEIGANFFAPVEPAPEPEPENSKPAPGDDWAEMVDSDAVVVEECDWTLVEEMAGVQLRQKASGFEVWSNGELHHLDSNITAATFNYGVLVWENLPGG